MPTRTRRPRSVAFHLVAPDPEPGVRLLRVEGPLSTDDHPQLRGMLYAVCEDNGSPSRAVVIDLRGCEFLATVCLREMVDASEELMTRGGWGVRLVIDETSSLERRMWPVPGHARLGIHPTSASAVSSVRGSPEAD